MELYSNRQGKSSTKLYRAWKCMIHRCNNPNYQRFSDYGGRGIKVCERWLDSFEAFAEDMGEPPTNRHELDRRDNEGDYEPNNCRWSTPRENSNNKRTTRFVDFEGERMPLSYFSDRVGIGRQVLYERIFVRGWSVEKAAREPV